MKEKDKELYEKTVEDLKKLDRNTLVMLNVSIKMLVARQEMDENHHRGYLIDPERNIQTFDTKQEIARGIVQTIYSEVEHR